MTPGLRDTFGRLHDSLRVSVTDRCNIRCFYCMPEQDAAFVPRAEILTYEEIDRLVRIAVELGITKVRITGGEPLVRKDLPDLVRKLAAVPGIEDSGAYHERRAARGPGRTPVRGRSPAHQHSPGHSGPRAIHPDHAPRRAGPRSRRHRPMPAGSASIPSRSTP